MKNQHHRTLNWAEAVRQAVEKAKPRKTQKLPVKPRKKAEPHADGVHWDEWSSKRDTTIGLHTCPFTGHECQHKDTCLNGKYAIDCWLRTSHLESQPEGRDTGLYRDSMG